MFPLGFLAVLLLYLQLLDWPEMVLQILSARMEGKVRNMTEGVGPNGQKVRQPVVR